MLVLQVTERGVLEVMRREMEGVAIGEEVAALAQVRGVETSAQVYP